jgi:hypothetical protein
MKILYIHLYNYFIYFHDNSKIGKYTKEPLPENFKYVITKDESNVALEKIKLMFN